VYTPLPGRDYPLNPMQSVEGGTVQLGKPRHVPTFGWDNEYGAEARSVAPFDAARFKVSNGEFLEFVQAGGYRTERHWSENGWKWRLFRNVKWPTFWVSSGPAGKHEYHLRTTFDVQPMPWSWPAEVNYHEAIAYTNWKSERDGVSYRPASEAEHVLLRDFKHGEVDPVMNAAGNAMAAEHNINSNLAYSSPWPVDAGVDAADRKAFGDTMGSTWEWVEDEFEPLPGFMVSELYDDFSTPCFDGEHRMIMGGSYISTGDEASAWSRFHFREHFHQATGFRLVSSTASKDASAPMEDEGERRGRDSRGMSYESDTLLHEYLLLHYGADADTLPFGFGKQPVGPRDAIRFPQRCAQLVAEWNAKLGLPATSALDVGCSVGGSTFELARTFERAVGVDYSAAFIDAAKTMGNAGAIPFQVKEQGEIKEWRVAALDEISRGETAFLRADACDLPPELEHFDAVLMANLLCRLPSPKALLGRLAGPRGLVKPGGLAVFISPYTWMEEHTPRGSWLGGFKDGDGAPVYSNETLQSILAADFELRHEEEMPLLLREHKRKYQYIVSHAMVFQRRAD